MFETKLICPRCGDSYVAGDGIRAVTTVVRNRVVMSLHCTVCDTVSELTVAPRQDGVYAAWRWDGVATSSEAMRAWCDAAPQPA